MAGVDARARIPTGNEALVIVTCPACGQPAESVRYPLTRQQRRMYDFLLRWEEEHGTFPTFGEIAHGLEYRSLATVAEHLDNLSRKGWIVRVSHGLAKRPYATVRTAWPTGKLRGSM